MSIGVVKEGKYYRFISNNRFHRISFPLYFHCDKCGATLNKEYSYIIWRLKNAKLLESSHKNLCCTCYYIKNLIDNSVCPLCSKKLKFECYKKHEFMRYYVIECNSCKYQRIVNNLYNL